MPPLLVAARLRTYMQPHVINMTVADDQGTFSVAGV
jgi:hypothetical protein